MTDEARYLGEAHLVVNLTAPASPFDAHVPDAVPVAVDIEDQTAVGAPHELRQRGERREPQLRLDVQEEAEGGNHIERSRHERWVVQQIADDELGAPDLRTRQGKHSL